MLRLSNDGQHQDGRNVHVQPAPMQLHTPQSYLIGRAQSIDLLLSAHPQHLAMARAHV